MKKENGIILVCLGHPYYSHMAFNLAVSIKYQDSTIPITVVKSGSSLDQLLPWQRGIFDNEVELDLNLIKRSGVVEYLKAKTLLYDLSPYEKTIYLDADTILSERKKIGDLFSLTGVQFANRGEMKDSSGISQWVDIKVLFDTYKIDHWYDLSSEFIFFDRSALNKKFFNDAKKYYDDDKIPVVTFEEKKKQGKTGITQFAGGKPDEVPFGIAIEKNNIRFQSPFQPSYWQPQYFNKLKSDQDILNGYYMISAGGNAVQQNIKRIYNNQTKYYFNQMGYKYTPYQLIAKSQVIAERKSI